MRKLAVSVAALSALVTFALPMAGCEERTITVPALEPDKNRPARGEGERESFVDPAVQRANAEAEAAKAEADRIRAEADKHDEAADAIEEAARAKEAAAEAKAEAARKQAEADAKDAEARAKEAAARATMVPSSTPQSPSPSASPSTSGDRLIDVDDGNNPAMDSLQPSDAGPQ